MTTASRTMTDQQRGPFVENDADSQPGATSGRPIAAYFRRIWLGASGSEWIAFALLVWMLAMVGWSVQLARWGDLPNIVPTALMGASGAFLMSRLKVNWAAKAVFFFAAGFAVTLWQGGIPADGANVIERSADAWARMQLWIDVAINGGVSGDTVPFALIFMATTWIVSYTVSALTFRTLSPWVPVIALGLGLLTNLSHRHGQFEYTFYLFVIGAAAQFAHLIALNRTIHWRSLGLKPPRSAMWQSARDGLALGATIVLVAALLPFYEVRSDTLEQRWNAIFLDPFLSLQSTAERLLAGVPSGKDAVLDAPDPVLPFQGAIELTDEPLFRVRSRYAKMHPGRIYQEYTSQGWVAAPSVRVSAPANARLEGESSYRGMLGRELVEIAIKPSGSANLVVPAGAVHSVNLRSVVDVLEPVTWDLRLTGPIDSIDLLPEDLREFGFALRSELLLIANKIESTDGTRFAFDNQPLMADADVDEAIRLLYRSDSNIPWGGFSFNLIETQPGAGVDYVRLVRQSPVEHNAVELAQDAVANQQFIVSTSVSTAEDEDLARADDDYPRYITDRYLQLPDSLPQAVRDLARDIAADSDATEPWEIAQAVKRFLQNQVYSLEIEGPDPFTDALQYFLFETVNEPCPSDYPGCDRSKIKGYSQYFGSAGTVLLRANGVPARMIAGWSTGEYLPSEGQFLIRDRNRHGWTQVYLPPFGWIDLEVTPGRPAVPRNLRVPITPIDEIPAPIVGSSEFDPDFMAELAYLESLALDAALPSETLRFDAETERSSGVWLPPWPLTASGGSVVILLLAVWMAWRWNLRGHDDAVRAYTQWTRVAALMGYRRPSYMSAREYGARLGSVSEQANEVANLIVDSYEKRVYGGDGSNDESAELQGDVSLSSAWRKAAGAIVKHRLRRIFRSGNELHIGRQ